MTIQSIADILESWAPLRLAEDYDNAGLITGDLSTEVTGILICLDSTESIVQEAISQGCNLIIAHHPIIFKGLKKITGSTYVERAIIQAIRNNMGIYALHTNLDNIITGVNSKIADLLELQGVEILQARPGFMVEEKMTGAGVLGNLAKAFTGTEFLGWVQNKLKLSVIKHTYLPEHPITRVAICGGAGSFLIPAALRAGANAFITSDLKYHEYFDADQKMLLLDVGHYEGERFTIDLIEEYLGFKAPQVRLYKTRLSTNPVQFFI